MSENQDFPGLSAAGHEAGGGINRAYYCFDISWNITNFLMANGNDYITQIRIRHG